MEQSKTTRGWTGTDFIGLALGLAAIALLVIAQPYAAGYADFRKTIGRILWDRWFDARSTVWQFGILVVPVVSWLVWKRRAALVRMTPAPSLLGLPILLVASSLYYVGFKANNYYFGFIGVQLFVLGGIIWLLGWRIFRAVLFPWLMLCFVWPLIFLEERISFPLRQLSTQGIMVFIRLLGAPVASEGTSLISTSPGHEAGSWLLLKVDGPCSGMNTLFALLFVGALVSYFAQPGIWRRALLFACCVPLALLGNMLRLALLILGCAVFGQQFAVGDQQNEMTTYHMLAGLMVFPVLIAGLRLISKVIHAAVAKRKKHHSPPRAESATPVAARKSLSIPS